MKTQTARTAGRDQRRGGAGAKTQTKTQRAKARLERATEATR